MKKLFFVLLLLGATHGVGGAKVRIVENPLIESANTRTLDIIKVELRDTATVLHVEAYYNPHQWIRIVKETYLQAGEQRYMLRGAEGIRPDELLWMPESGRASFKLWFDPLPAKARSFDFIESDCDDCFKLYGIDLTGKTRYDSYPAGLPKALQKEPVDGPVPDPIFKVGETTINVHLLGYRKGMFNEMALYVERLLANQKEYTAPIDPATGTAVFQFEQYCSGTMILILANIYSAARVFWTAPGETIDLYVDLRTTGRDIVQRRNPDQPLPHISGVYSTGIYADMTRLCGRTNESAPIALIPFAEDFTDYRLSADEYTRQLVSKYTTLSDSIARQQAPQMLREHSQLVLQQETLSAIVNCSSILGYNYRVKNKIPWNQEITDQTFAEPSTENYAAILGLFDYNNPKLLMGSLNYWYNAVGRGIDWPSIPGIREGLLLDLNQVGWTVYKAEDGSPLSDEEKAQLRAIKNPFYAEMYDAISANVKKEQDEAPDTPIEQAPDVPVEELFDAIVAPYKGKVVFVDFWNTWCGPCRMSIKATEPLKSEELKSDDLVWIYIANETSPLPTYKVSIAKIAGKHYRLNAEQWKHLCEQFKIDGIPSYVLVNKDGTYGLRNDLRDHHRLKETLKKMIE